MNPISRGCKSPDGQALWRRVVCRSRGSYRRVNRRCPGPCDPGFLPARSAESRRRKTPAAALCAKSPLVGGDY
ncbi:MAG: hypothetical protein IKX88_09670 [Thermoguttaceae bacterium]|nr:hypothetical protein [Thermoguttaceae bacterium]